jgi:hypothetical protein
MTPRFGPWGRLVIARHERRLEIPDAHGHVEVMLLEILRQHLHRPRLHESDFRMSSDVVSERDQLLVHELLGTRRDGIPSGIRAVSFVTIASIFSER